MTSTLCAFLRHHQHYKKDERHDRDDAFPHRDPHQTLSLAPRLDLKCYYHTVLYLHTT